MDPGVIFVVHSDADLLRNLGRRGLRDGVLFVFGRLGGWPVVGGVLAALTRITDARAGRRTGCSPTESATAAATFRELADNFDTMLARLEAHVAEQ